MFLTLSYLVFKLCVFPLKADINNLVVGRIEGQTYSSRMIVLIPKKVKKISFFELMHRHIPTSLSNCLNFAVKCSRILLIQVS